jgi:ABC-type branched-subunit amino acid transport system substrate-binding protein
MNHFVRVSRTWSVGLAVCALVTASLVAGASANVASAAVKFKGKPIIIAVNVPIDTTAYSYPQAVSGAMAAARAINAAGGLKGHKVVIDSCNTKVDPNQEVACARKAVSEGAIAAVDSYPVANAQGYESVLAAGHVAEVAGAGTTPLQFAGNTTFPIDFGPGAYAACASKAVAKAAGITSIADAAIDVPAVAPYVALISSAATNSGLTNTGTVMFPIQSPDMASLVQQLSTGNPGLVVMTVGSFQVVPLIEAAQGVGKTWAYCGSPSITGASTMIPLGSAASDFYQGSAFPPLSAASHYPVLRKFVEQMAVEFSAGDQNASTGINYNEHSMRAWIGMQIIAQAINSLKGPITKTAFLAAMRKTVYNSGGMIPTINFSKSYAAGPYKKVYNPFVELQKWDVATSGFNIVPGGFINAATIGYGS